MDDSYPLTASAYKQDPRISEGKKLLLDAVKSHQQNIQAVRPPQAELQQSYKETLHAFQVIRGANLYFPYIGSGIGRGPLVELLDGSVKYDMICGIGPHFWGHSHPPLIEVSIDAALSDTIMQGHLQQNMDVVLLSKLLTSSSGFDHCFLSSSGAMANENGLKIAFQHKFPATRLLALDSCFMGRTLTLSQITDKPQFREGLPSNLAIDYVPFYSHLDPEKSTENALRTLRHHLYRHPNEHAVMCFELVQGESGFYAGSTQYFSALMKVLKEHNILILVDEVQTFGRTPELFSYQYFKLQEFVDIVSIGKLAQVCATLFTSKIKPKPGLLSQTFISSTTALQTSSWIIKTLLEDHFFGPDGKIVTLHARFEEHFQRLEKKWPERIQGPYGLGGMIAFTPFGGEAKQVIQFVQDLFQAGVIAFVAGSSPTRIRFLIPAGVMTNSDVDSVMRIVENLIARGGI